MQERLHWRCTGLVSAPVPARSRESRPILEGGRISRQRCSTLRDPFYLTSTSSVAAEAQAHSPGANRVSYRIVSLAHDGKRAVRAGRLDEPASSLQAAKTLARLRYPQVRAGWFDARYGIRILDASGHAVCERTLDDEKLGTEEPPTNHQSPQSGGAIPELARRVKRLISRIFVRKSAA